MSESRIYVVEGMSCEHCRSSVEEELREIDGVERVDVRLDDGSVEVHGGGFGDEQVEAAVVEAGYTLAGKR